MIAPGEKNGQQFNKQNSHFERKRERVREYEEKRLTVWLYLGSRVGCRVKLAGKL